MRLLQFLISCPPDLSPGHNVITLNQNCAISASYYSNVWLGSSAYGGYNNVIASVVGAAIWANSNCTISAQRNWWGAYPPNANWFYATNQSTIDYSNALSYNPNPNVIAVGIANIPTPLLSYSSMDNATTTASGDSLNESDYNNAFQSLMAGNYQSAMTQYTRIFNLEKNRGKKKYALTKLAECYWSAGRKDFIDFMDQEIRPNLSRTDDIYSVTLDLENYWHLNAGNYDRVVSNLSLVKTLFGKDDEINKQMLFNLGYIYYVYLQDIPRANAYFTELESKYPKDQLVLDIKILLGEVPPALNLSQNNLSKPSQTETSIPEEYELNVSPNPFNPSTGLLFDLPEAAFVTLKIYDVLGREVQTLADGEYNAGVQRVTWNASNRASGMYIARITIRDASGNLKYSNSQKLLLMK